MAEEKHLPAREPPVCQRQGRAVSGAASHSPAALHGPLVGAGRHALPCRAAQARAGPAGSRGLDPGDRPARRGHAAPRAANSGQGRTPSLPTPPGASRRELTPFSYRGEIHLPPGPRLVDARRLVIEHIAGAGRGTEQERRADRDRWRGAGVPDSHALHLRRRLPGTGSQKLPLFPRRFPLPSGKYVR